MIMKLNYKRSKYIGILESGLYISVDNYKQ